MKSVHSATRDSIKEALLRPRPAGRRGSPLSRRARSTCRPAPAASPDLVVGAEEVVAHPLLARLDVTGHGRGAADDGEAILDVELVAGRGRFMIRPRACSPRARCRRPCPASDCPSRPGSLRSARRRLAPHRWRRTARASSWAFSSVSATWTARIRKIRGSWPRGPTRFHTRR